MTPLPVSRPLLLMLATLGLAACGAGQAIHDGTANTLKRITSEYVGTARIELRYTPSTNPRDEPLTAIVLRVYQLRASETFLALTDEQLLMDDQHALHNDLLTTNDVHLRPRASQSLREPMHEQTHAIGVIAFFAGPDKLTAARLIVPRKAWPKTDPVTIDIAEQMLRVRDDTARK